MPPAQPIASVSRWPDTNERARLDLDQASLRAGATMSGVVHLVGNEPRATMSCRLVCVQLIHEGDTDNGTFVKVLWAGGAASEAGNDGRELRFRIEIPPTCPPSDASRRDHVVWVLEVVDDVERDWAWQHREYGVRPRRGREWIVAQFQLEVKGAPEEARWRTPAPMRELAEFLGRDKPKRVRVRVDGAVTEIAVSVWKPQIVGGAAVAAFASLGLLPLFEGTAVKPIAVVFAAAWVGLLLPIALGGWFERVRVVFSASGLRLERRVLLTRRRQLPYAEIVEADYEVTGLDGFRPYVRRRSGRPEKFLLARNQPEATVRWLMLAIKKAAGLPLHFSPQA